MNMLEVIVAGAQCAAPGKPASAAPLLKCPFCGRDPRMAREIAGHFLVGCADDACHVNPQVSGQSPQQAWKRWNWRQA